MGAQESRLKRLDHLLSSNAVTRKLYPNYYFRARVRRRLERGHRAAVPHKFLFVLCPPYAGSTLLDELLSTSSAVSCNHERGHREGQKLPEARPLMWDMGRAARWDESRRLDWPAIRRVWMRYWDLSKPLLLEKSPPNLIRAADIEAHFEPAFFVCMVRDPYAQCESLMRRAGFGPRAAAEFAVRCLEHQRRNVLGLRHALMIRYEDLGERPGETCDRLVAFLPELGALDHRRRFLAHNESGTRMPISNLNAGKIARLGATDVEVIGDVLRGRLETLSYFGYRPA
jgi:hypothetical protein